MSKQPIGIFDSGIGGTSIWKEIIKYLPKESTIYLADSKNAPYGDKSEQHIIDLCKKNTELLLKHDCKLIVVACNTATTNAINFLRKNYPIPFVGIEPAIKPAAIQTNTKTIGILATKGTLSSSLFHNTNNLYSQGVHVIEQVGEGLVPLIEEGRLDGSELFELLKSYLTPMIEAGIDYLVLGCTHYPYLIPVIKKIVPSTVTVIDSGEAVARQTKKVLEENKLLNLKDENNEHYLYTNASEKLLNYFLKDALVEMNVTYLDF